MNLPLLAARNTLRNKTRTLLTIMGVMVAVVAFGFLRTVIKAYYLGVETAAKDRLVTRNQVSLVVPLPYSYKAKIGAVPGVTKVAAGSWFGGIYIDEKNFFANFAVEPEFLDLYPEYVLTPDEKQAYLADRTGCVVGEKLARKYGWKVGDSITLKGTIYAGDWKLTVRAIYEPREKSTDATQLFLHWKYVDEGVTPEQHGKTGLYFVGIADPNRSAEISKAIDQTFKGSNQETLTESEKAFQMSFIAMVSTVINALEVISFFVMIIVALILGNTIAMSVRDRSAEVAILKALGFSGGKIAALITAESAFVGALGGALGVLAAVPLIRFFGGFIEENMGSFFPVFHLAEMTMLQMIGLSVLVGFAAACIPAARVAGEPVASSLRRA